MRDEATYQLALVHRAQNKPELAVPLLIQIVKSQNPTRDLGKKLISSYWSWVLWILQHEVVVQLLLPLPLPKNNLIPTYGCVL